jgi:hypothetical protein
MLVLQVISSHVRYNGHHGANPLPPSPSLQQVGGGPFGPTRSIYLNLLYESQDCKWVRST